MPVRVLAQLYGGLLDPDEPFLTADDLGILRGDGAFETILVVDGVPLQYEAHLARLASTAAMLELPEPDLSAWRSCVDTALGAWTAPGEMMLRLVLTRGRETGGAVTGYAMGVPVPRRLLDQRRDGVSVLALTRGYPVDLAGSAPWLLLGAKTLSYAVNMAAIRYAAANGADDVVFLATDGSVFEGPTATVVIANGRTLRTTPPEIGILPGTTQSVLFDAAAAAGWTTSVEPLTLADLHGADGVWLVSSVRLLTRVHTLDGTPLPDPGTTAELDAFIPRS